MRRGVNRPGRGAVRPAGACSQDVICEKAAQFLLDDGEEVVMTKGDDGRITADDASLPS